jgi:hypothetical protein
MLYVPDVTVIWQFCVSEINILTGFVFQVMFICTNESSFWLLLKIRNNETLLIGGRFYLKKNHCIM